MKPRLLILIAVVLSCLSFTGVLGNIRIDSTRSTISSCSNNGSILVFASTDRPALNYSIIAGPVTRSQQTSNLFNSLPAGVYTVKVINAILESATQQVTISGNYIPPNINPIKINPYCTGGSDGMIIGNLTANTGKGPFSWQLIAPSPVTTVPQASDTFRNLVSGSYTIRMSDSCGNFLTYAATLTEPNTRHAFYRPPVVEITGCDTAFVILQINMPENAIRLPLRFKYQTRFGTYIPPADSIRIDTTQIRNSPFGLVGVIQVLPGITYGDTIVTTVYNSCGDSIVATSALYPFNFYPTFSYRNCGTEASVIFNYMPNQNFVYGLKAPVKYIFKDSATNVIIDSATLPGNPSHAIGTMITSIRIRPFFPAGHTYHIMIQDGCGKIFQQNYAALAPVVTPLVTSKVVLTSACIDSAAGAVKIRVNGFSGNKNLIITSGPQVLGSSRPDFIYTDTYSYPDTISIDNTQSSFNLINLAAGTYRFRVEDDCGNIVNDSITIKKTDVTSLDRTVSYKQGCLGQYSIHYTLSHGGASINAMTNQAAVVVKRLQDGVILRNQNYTTNNAADSVLISSPGRYEVVFQYRQTAPGTFLNDNYHTCTTVIDTVNVVAYQSPAIGGDNSIVCGNNISIELLPDSSRGVPPYRYEIIAGPQTFPIQSSNIFSTTLRGIYTVRIYDVCGNASATSINVDTVKFSPLGKIRIGCKGIKLFYNTSSLYSFGWLKPNNQLYHGDTLTINPISSADTGLYRVYKVININGCRDTFYTSFSLDFTEVYNRFTTICQGDSVLFNGKNYNADGIYRDTLMDVTGCDSIIVLHLQVTPYKRDTLNVTICEGQNYSVGSSTYFQTGIYSDTLSTTDCDSIVLLRLNVTPYKRDSLNISICEEQSFTVGSKVYTLPGIYIDTLSTAGCDSIVVLNLQVNPYKRDSLNITICEGHGFSVGSFVYTQPGIYIDTLSTTGCDSIVVLNLGVNPYKRDSLHVTICEGKSFNVGTSMYSLPGVYSDTLATTGCDSIVVLNLQVTPYKRTLLNITICEGQQYVVAGSTYIQTGVYSDTISTAGCDSIVLLNLQVTPYKRDSLNITICEGQSFTVGSNIYNQTGFYTDTFSTAGCDSIVLLQLQVNPYKRDSLYIALCEGQSFSVGSNSYNQTGYYIDTLATAGCDSIVVLNLRVDSYKRDSLNITLCEGQYFTVGTNQYTQSGLYIDTLATSSCDSIVVLSLLVNPYKRDSLNITICEGQLYSAGSNNYTQTGIYIDTLATLGCDSIVVLDLLVNPYKRDSLNITICEGQSFNAGNSTYTQTGIYADTLATSGCDSIVVLKLTVNPYKRDSLNITLCEGQNFIVGSNSYNLPGTYTDTIATSGCDSIVVLNLTVNPYKRDSLNITICEGQHFVVGSNNYTQAGIYIDTLSTTGCDSIVVLNLQVNSYKRDSLNITICEGQSFNAGSSIYTQNGIYADTLTTSGCDSIVVLNLHVNPYKRDSLNITLCEGQLYSVGSNNYTQTGIYIDTLSTMGCDSIVVLNLLVNPYKRDSLNITLCEGQRYMVGVNSYAQTGIYIDTLSTAGCDSIVVLNLRVNPYKRDTLHINLCDGQSFTVGTNSYTLPGTYTDTLSTTGCDSIVVLNLQVNPYKRNSLSVTLCEGQSYSVGTNSYTQTGIYTDTLSTASCDSIVVLNLHINPYKRDSLNITLCEGQSYSVGTNAYNQTGIYRDTLSTVGCDSIVVLSLLVNPYKRDSLNITLCEGQFYSIGTNVYSQTGIYRDTLSTVGCDSIVLLNLQVNPYKRDSLNITLCEGQSYSVGTNAYMQTGIYTDTFTTTGCDSIVVLDLLVTPTPIISISATPQPMFTGQTLQLNASFASAYLWSGVQGFDNNSIRNPRVTLNNSAWIYLQSTNNPGNCTAYDSVYIVVNIPPVEPPCPATTYIYLPNAFSPGDADQVNNLFRIRSNNIRLVQFEVYNRAGERVFATKNINDAWDGRYKGKITVGNYVYRVAYYDCNPSTMKVKTGSILLIN